MINLPSLVEELKTEQQKQLLFIKQKLSLSNPSNTANENIVGEESKFKINTLHESCFKLPICYTENKFEINSNILNDLELTNCKDCSNNPMYSVIFTPENVFGKKYINQWSKYYTTDVPFLSQSQQFFESFQPIQNISSDIKPKEICSNINDLWLQIINDTKFKESFGYIDSPVLHKLNHSPMVLQLLSIYNLSSPVISLLSPIVLLIIPFFILKLQKLQVSFSTYISSLKTIMATHPIGKIFSLSELGSMQWDKRIYIIMSVIFYFVQIYQNIMSCIRFYKNMFLIHKNLFLLRDYFQFTINQMNHILTLTQHLSTYSNFKRDLETHKCNIENLYNILTSIKPFKCNINKLFDIGHIMKLNYELFVDNNLQESVDYSFGFNSFYENISHFKILIQEKKINKCIFSSWDNKESEDSNTESDNESELSDASTSSEKSSSSKKESKKQKKYKNKKNKKSNKNSNVTKFINIYYPNTENPVKNNITLDKNIIITGPNASGKTTNIKSVLLNIILSQQTGYGFYDSAIIKPYDYLHCYLNIPDTSGRDSLFQAESRRCKEILDIIELENNKKHFCIFDELYSGTNPYEAVASAFGYIDTISEMKNVNLMLTTHYIELCNKLENNKNVENVHMDVEIIDDQNINYLYKLKKGISTIKGGIKVLCDLDYPQNIIDKTKQVLSEL